MKLLAALGALLGPVAVVVASLSAAVGYAVVPSRIERAAGPLILVGVLVYAVGVLLC